MCSVKAKNNISSQNLIFLAWLVYTTSYIGRVNYSANITQIIDFYTVTKAQAGLVPTFFFFSYGMGQFVNGIFCKRYNIKWMVFTSLLVSGLINFTVALGTDFSIVKWLWMVNGILLSVLWPTLIRLLSENLEQKQLGKSSVVMGTTVASGTLIIYALSSLYAALGNFKLSFFTAAILDIFVSVIWILRYNRVVCASSAKEKIFSPVDVAKNSCNTQKQSIYAAAQAWPRRP